MKVLTDTRAQSVGISRFLLSMLVAVVLAWIVKTVTEPILSESQTKATEPAAINAVSWLQAGTESLFVFFLVIGLFGIVALAVYQREVLG